MYNQISLIYPPSPAEVLPRPTIDSKAEEAPSIEMLPIVDGTGTVIAQASRKWLHGKGSGNIHPVVHAYFINRYSDIFLQRRSMDKDIYPGRWDFAVGGHVVYGEQPLETLFRESEEELRFTRFNPISLGAYVYPDPMGKEYVNIFAAVGDFEIENFGEEVMDGRWWSQKEIQDNLAKSLFTPNFEDEYVQVFPKLEALL